ncbi:MAG: DNA adenine methylase [Myxococcota bacterium]
MKAAVPFLKWAGGKRALVPEILARLPDSIDTYYEPFLGGGAVFFALAARGAFKRAVICDRNRDLIDAYLGVRDDVEGVIARLARLRHDARTYARVRSQDPAKLTLTRRAARIIYLNRTCYNGLYRVNRKGQFNVPFGRYKNPRILDRENLRAVSRTLQKARIAESKDFEALVEKAEPGDAVYFDPPYAPVSPTSSFTAYDSLPFGEDEQERLAKVMRQLQRRRVYALLSNSDVPLTRRLYKRYACDSVQVHRRINSRPDRRGPISELLVRTHARIPRPRG